MKLKHLQSALEDIEPFDLEKMKVQLEQYPTSPSLAAEICFIIQNQFQDIKDRIVVDLGCGTGRLSFACFLLEAKFILGVDSDPDALEVALRNQTECLEEDEQGIKFIQCEVEKGMDVVQVVRSSIISYLGGGAADTVVMNPPFGTRVQGIDMLFLEAALKIAPRVYSLHKTSTREFIMKKAKTMGAKAKVLAELKFDVPPMYKFHKEKSRDIAVDLVLFWI